MADLQRDYAAMSGMIFGPVPSFDAVLESSRAFEIRLNEARDWSLILTPAAEIRYATISGAA